jgi:hypothetical protein
MASVGGGGDSSQEFDLNIAPIIDCFTVLITYLLVSASFVSLKAIDSEIAVVGSANSSAASQSPPPSSPPNPPMAMTLRLASSKSVQISLSGGTIQSPIQIQVPAKNNGEFDAESLSKQIQDLNVKFQKIDDVSVSADAGIIYREIVQLMERVKSSYPRVAIAVD